MPIVVLDGYTLNPGDLSWKELEKLDDLSVFERTPPEKVVERASGARILLTNKAPITAETIAALPSLEFISVMATGYNIVDVAAAAARGIPVSNVPVYGTDSVAQFVFALLLERCHRISLHDEAVKSGEWETAPDWCFWKSPQTLLQGKNMGIVGFGRIGRRVGELAHAFGMSVLANDARPENRPDYEPFSWKSIEELFSEADVVSVHCPQTQDNAEFINDDLFSLMKKEAVLINTARGGLIDETALARALNNGTLSAAALDVVSTEPIRRDN
ncbi:MAG: D-2-hydroxyacid dehydrogenase, partial [Deltaproteobacteria bacterium]|nr:D-2-hydroxyacid dehydrogenase [Deltaproteobacteria bacterium]